MTIKEFAASRGASRQRVYQLIKENGKQVSDLTDGKGNITQSGLEFLQNIVPDKTAPVQTEQSSGSEEKQTKESKSELQSLLDTINTMSETIKDLNEQIKREQEISKQAQINLSQEQHLHADTKKQLQDLQLRLTAGSPEGESDPQPIPADGQEDPSQETEESEQKQDSPQNEDKPDPEGKSPEEKKQNPEKREGETAPAESSSPVTTDQKPDQKPEEKTKATLKQRLRFLFTGER